MGVGAWLAQERRLVAVMVLLQVLWLMVKWVRGSALSWTSFGAVVLYTVGAAVAARYWSLRTTGGGAPFAGSSARAERHALGLLCVVVLVAGIAYVLRPWPQQGTDEYFMVDASGKLARDGMSAFLADYARIPRLGRRHPPGGPLVYGFIMQISGIHLVAARLVCLALMIGTILLTYRLGSELYDGHTGVLAALALLSFPLSFRYGLVATNDAPVMFLFALAALLILRLLRAPAYRLSAATGVCIGAGLLVKYTMALIYPLLLVWAARRRASGMLRLHLVLVLLLSVTFLTAWILYAAHVGAFAAQRTTITSYAATMLTTGGGRRWLPEQLGKLAFGAGLYNMPLLLLAGMRLLRDRSCADVFVLTWIGTVGVLLLLTLPDPRYFMPAVPALAIALASGVRRTIAGAWYVVLLGVLYSGAVVYVGLLPRQ